MKLVGLSQRHQAVRQAFRHPSQPDNPSSWLVAVDPDLDGLFVAKRGFVEAVTESPVDVAVVASSPHGETLLVQGEDVRRLPMRSFSVVPNRPERRRHVYVSSRARMCVARGDSRVGSEAPVKRVRRRQPEGLATPRSRSGDTHRSPTGSETERSGPGGGGPLLSLCTSGGKPRLVSEPPVSRALDATRVHADRSDDERGRSQKGCWARSQQPQIVLHSVAGLPPKRPLALRPRLTTGLPLSWRHVRLHMSYRRDRRFALARRASPRAGFRRFFRGARGASGRPLPRRRR